MLEDAEKFLGKYWEDIKTGKNELKVSYDLWEMHEGISIYSLSAIFAANDAMLKIYKILEDEEMISKLKQESINKRKEVIENYQKEIKKYIVDEFYDEEKKSFINNQKDKKIDISILGIITPFNIFSPNERKITNTIERINMNLRTYTRRISKIRE